MKDQQTGRVVLTIFPSAAAQQREIVNGTYVPPSNAGNTGGVPNNDTFHVVACSSVYNNVRPGSGDVGHTGNTGNTGAG